MNSPLAVQNKFLLFLFDLEILLEKISSLYFILLIFESICLISVHEPVEEIEKNSYKENKMCKKKSNKHFFWDSYEIVHGAFLKI